MNNLRILLYMMLLSLAACHPEGTSVKQGLDKAAQLMEQDLKQHPLFLRLFSQAK